MKKNHRVARVAGWFILTAVVFVAAYLLMIRPWHREWGATDDEIGQDMPADDIVKNPNYLVTTRAITINAKPEEIWPWLVQMGYKRGGLYSYDWLDRLAGILDRPSADRILPEFQDLRPGDEIPLGSGPGWPVKSMDPNRSMVFDIEQPGIHLTWSWGLSPIDASSTRLILRIRGNMKITPGQAPLFAFMDPAEFVMVRKMLSGLKQRVEGTIGTPTDELVELLLWAVALLCTLITGIGAFIKRESGRATIVAGASFLVFFFLALGQPRLWVGIVLNLILLRSLYWALWPQKKASLIL